VMLGSLSICRGRDVVHEAKGKGTYGHLAKKLRGYVGAALGAGMAGDQASIPFTGGKQPAAHRWNRESIGITDRTSAGEACSARVLDHGARVEPDSREVIVRRCAARVRKTGGPRPLSLRHDVAEHLLDLDDVAIEITAGALQLGRCPSRKAPQV